MTDALGGLPLYTSRACGKSAGPEVLYCLRISRLAIEVVGKHGMSSHPGLER